MEQFYTFTIYVVIVSVITWLVLCSCGLPRVSFAPGTTASFLLTRTR
jgi:hypothetical protein